MIPRGEKKNWVNIPIKEFAPVNGLMQIMVWEAGVDFAGGGLAGALPRMEATITSSLI